MPLVSAFTCICQKYISLIQSIDAAMRILVVNNYGQFNHLIRRSIRDKVETDLIQPDATGEITADA